MEAKKVRAEVKECQVVEDVTKILADVLKEALDTAEVEVVEKALDEKDN